MQLSNEEFSELVSADARWQDPTPERPNPHNKITPEQRQWLRDPDNLDRWMDELKATMRKIDSQITSHKAEAFRQRIEYLRTGSTYQHDNTRRKGTEAFDDFQAEEITWKASAVRFRRSVEDRLREAQQINRTLHPVETGVEIQKLRSAIVRHRNTFEDEASVEDKVLWKVVEAS